MNILQINTDDNRGGAARVAWMLKENLELRDHVTSLFVKNKHSENKNVFKLLRFPRQEFISYYFSTDLDFYSSDCILKTKEFKKADIVHCHNLHGYFFKLKTIEKMAKLKPIIWTLHDMWAITPHCAHAFNDQVNNGFYECSSLDVYPGLYWHNEKYLCRKKEDVYNNSRLDIVVPSLWLKEKVKKSVLRNQNITLIYNGIDVEKFQKYNKNEARKKLNLPQNSKVVMFLAENGRSNPWKGWEYAEKVINFYNGDKNIVFLCIGGNDKDCFLNSPNVKYIEYINNKNLLAQYYSASDIFLFTSVAENFPLVILEAMICGAPIVSFDVGGVKEVVTHKQNGYIAEYKNIEDLIRGIEYIFGLNQEQLNQISQNSIKKVKESFSLDIMIDNYLKLYQKIL